MLKQGIVSSNLRIEKIGRVEYIFSFKNIGLSLYHCSVPIRIDFFYFAYQECYIVISGHSIQNITVEIISQDHLVAIGFHLKSLGKLRSKKAQSTPAVMDYWLKDSLAFFPNKEVEFIADAGHWLHAEQPDAVVDEIRKFLN